MYTRLKHGPFQYSIMQIHIYTEDILKITPHQSKHPPVTTTPSLHVPFSLSVLLHAVLLICTP